MMTLSQLFKRKQTTSPFQPQRVKTPTVLQIEAVECGAASLAMIMAYYKKIEPLEKLRLQCGVSRDGSKAVNILKAARHFGFEATGFKCELEELNDFEVPFIIFWEFNHFLVVEGFKGNKVYLNDPALGRRTVTLEEFDRSFTGIVLEMKPSKEFVQSGKAPSMVQALKTRMQGSYTALLYLILVGLALVVPGLLVPIFTKVFIDSYLIDNMTSWVKPLLIGMAITAVLQSALTWLRSHCLTLLGNKLAITMSSRFFWHIIKLPIEFFSQRSIGDLTNRITLNNNIAKLIAGRLTASVINLFMIVFYAILMFYYNVTLTLIGIGVALLNLVVLKVVAQYRIEKSQQVIIESSKLFGASISGLMTIETLKATGNENDFFSTWSGHQAKVNNVLQKFQETITPILSVPALLTTLNTTLILLFGSLLVMRGQMTVGMLVAFQGLMAGFISPLQSFLSTIEAVQSLNGDIRQVDDVLNYPPAAAYEKQCQRENEPLDNFPNKMSGNIELKNLEFGYSPLEEPLLNNFSITLSPGEKIALVGPSGCGKSTVSKLVMGLYAPWKGDILYDNYRLDEIPLHIFSNSVAIVDQEVILFGDTIRNNITLWDHTIPEENIINATKDACIHDDIVARVNGYDEILGEGGTGLSGGQKQRLEIARALVLNPTILVLDEATSALDPITEMTIIDNLRKRGCTMLVIAHRLSTIRDCDQIIVLKHGQIMASGTHEQLIKQEGLYADLMKTE